MSEPREREPLREPAGGDDRDVSRRGRRPRASVAVQHEHVRHEQLAEHDPLRAAAPLGLQRVCGLAGWRPDAARRLRLFRRFPPIILCRFSCCPR